MDNNISKTYSTTMVSVRLPERLWNTAKLGAGIRGQSAQAFVEEALIGHLAAFTPRETEVLGGLQAKAEASLRDANPAS